MSKYPNRVPREEIPEPTVENIPDDVVDSAISIAVSYGECKECGERQWYNVVPGHNSSHTCTSCGEVMRIVG